MEVLNNITFGKKYNYTDELKRQYRTMDPDDIQYLIDEFAETREIVILAVRIPRNISALTNKSTEDVFIELPTIGDEIRLFDKDNKVNGTYENIETISNYRTSVNTGIVILRLK